MDGESFINKQTYRVNNYKSINQTRNNLLRKINKNMKLKNNKINYNVGSNVRVSIRVEKFKNDIEKNINNIKKELNLLLYMEKSNLNKKYEYIEVINKIEEIILKVR